MPLSLTSTVSAGRAGRTTAPLLLAAVLLAWAAPALAEVKTKVVEYRQGDTPLEGFLAWDDGIPGKRPGVLVIHEWWGQNQHARNQALRLARAGYVGLALDMYGKGKIATHPQDAKAFVAEATKEPSVMKARFDAAMKLLEAQPQVDARRIGAVGYCFGGAVALEMALAGEELAAVATFHAGMPSGSEPIPKGQVKPRILIATGGADPMVPPEQVEAFAKRLEDAGANVTVVVYPNAKHSFTNPDAARAGMEGLAYDEEADRKSWEAALKLFRQAFKS